MATLPESQSELLNAIDSAFVAQADLAPRSHLGASLLGRECERALWYSFHWAITTNNFSGRMLRLFARGQREEEWFATLLKLAGITVQLHDTQGQQFRFFEPGLGGHLSGSLDGIALGIPEAPKAWHILEFKTHNEKSFSKLCKDGVQAAKPEHFGQMQLYMQWAGLERALYLAVNKNDDNLYAERVAYDETYANTLVRKAERIIRAERPPSKLSDDPAFYICKFCDFHTICHGTAVPSVNCRTCLHSTPVVDDTAEAKWHCAKWDALIPLQESRIAMDCHRYLPTLLPWAEAADSTDDGDVIYQLPDGRQFTNGESVTLPGDARPYLSTELCVATQELLGNPDVEALRAQMDGSFVLDPAPVAIEVEDDALF